MRAIAGVWFGVVMASTLGAQTVAAPDLVLMAPGGTLIGFETFIADIAGADVVFLHEHDDTAEIHRFEAAVFQALAGRREVVLALDAVDRTAQDALEHFQMEHLSEEEFLAQARISARTAAAYLPLMRFAIARRWPIVATGPRTGGEDSIASTLVQSLAIGSAGGKRPLLVSLHAGRDQSVVETAAGLVIAQSPGRRAVTARLVAVRSLETVTPAAATPTDPTYTIYSLMSR